MNMYQRDINKLAKDFQFFVSQYKDGISFVKARRQMKWAMGTDQYKINSKAL